MSLTSLAFLICSCLVLDPLADEQGGCTVTSCSEAVDAAGEILQLRLPFRTGEQYVVTQGYCVDVDNQLCSHTGFEVDFSLPHGTAVSAASSGTVAYSGLGFCGALYVKIEHTVQNESSQGVETFYSYYYHLSASTVSIGTNVAPGDVIGYSGATGCVTGPHLHFELRKATQIANVGVRPIPMAGHVGGCGEPGGSIMNFVPGQTYQATGTNVFAVGQSVQVFNTKSLNTRQSPCGTAMAPLQEGAIVTVIDGPVCCDGHNRWKVSWAPGEFGWSAQDWLRAVDCQGECFVIQPGPEGKDTSYGTTYYTNGNPDGDTLYFGGWGDYYFDFIEFDLSGSPSASATTQAVLYLWAAATPNDPGLQIRRITAPWTEAGVSGSVNPSSDEYKPFGPVVLPNGWKSVDITDVYKDWKSGVNANYGLKFSATSVNGTNGQFVSSDHADASRRPRLVIYAAPHIPSDLNGDGVVDGADLGFVLSAWGACAGCPADLNHDGDVNGADMSALLSAWTAG